jgi:hypothetical protein
MADDQDMCAHLMWYYPHDFRFVDVDFLCPQ